MKCKMLLLVLFIVGVTNCYSQERIHFNGKWYNATKEFGFQPGTDLQIIDKGDGSAMVAFSCYTRIVGRVTLLLDNEEMIYLVDRKIYSEVNDINTTIYYVTNSELGKMAQSNVNNITFSTLDVADDWGSRSNHRQINVSRRGIFQNDEIDRVDVPKIICDLMGCE